MAHHHLAIVETNGMLPYGQISHYLMSKETREEIEEALKEGIDIPFNFDVWAHAYKNEGRVSNLTVKTKYLSPN